MTVKSKSLAICGEWKEGLRMGSLLINKNVIIMGLRNKWSIAWGIAKAAQEEGANLIVMGGTKLVLRLKRLKNDFFYLGFVGHPVRYT